METEKEFIAGVQFGQNLDPGEYSRLGDSLVLGTFDWTEWFDEYPGKSFIRGFKESWSPDREISWFD